MGAGAGQAHLPSAGWLHRTRIHRPIIPGTPVVCPHRGVYRGTGRGVVAQHGGFWLLPGGRGGSLVPLLPGCLAEGAGLGGGSGALLGLAGGACGKACRCTPSASPPGKPRACLPGHSPALPPLGVRLARGRGAGRLAAPFWEPWRRLSRRVGGPGVAAFGPRKGGQDPSQHPNAAPPGLPAGRPRLVVV